jgi:biotin-dependent carboxylase-like uncharacterized protein
MTLATSGVRDIVVNGTVHSGDYPVDIVSGDLVHVGPLLEVRAYLAIAGGIDVPVVLGSRSTDFTAAIGGLEGRVLRAGDILRTGIEPPYQNGGSGQVNSYSGQTPDYSPLRVILGPRSQQFSPSTLEALLSHSYTMHPSSNIMGIRLRGPAVKPRPGQLTLPSEGTVPGAIQVPPDGQPIILLNQRGTIGGYPVVAVIITPDLWRLAQWPYTKPLRFRAVTLAEGQRLAGEAWQRMGGPSTHM